MELIVWMQKLMGRLATTGDCRPHASQQRCTEVIRAGIAGGRIPLTGLDVIGGHRFSWHTYFYRSTPNVARLKSSLSEILRQMPIFAGRMKSSEHGLYIDCNDAGIPFTVIDAVGSMPDYGLHRPLEADRRRYVDRPPLRIVDRDRPLCLIRVTRFSDGGGVIGLTWAHSLVDGTAHTHFVSRWARQGRGEPSLPPPDLDRNRLLKMCWGAGEQPSDVSTLVELSPLSRLIVTARISWGRIAASHYLFRIPPPQLDLVRRLRNSTNDYFLGEYRITTNDILCAILWRRIAQIRKPTRRSSLALLHNLRGMAGLELSDDYLGNALMQVYLACDSEQLLVAPIEEVARRIRVAIGRVTTYQVRRELAYIATQTKRDVEFSLRGNLANLSDGLLCSNVSRFPVDELDFGFGKPCWIEGQSCKLTGHLCSIASTPDNDGSLIVHLVLPRGEMKAFKHKYGDGFMVADDFWLL